MLFKPLATTHPGAEPDNLVSAEELQWIEAEQFHDEWSDHLLSMDEPQGFDFGELQSVDLCNGDTRQSNDAGQGTEQVTDNAHEPTTTKRSPGKKPSDAALFN